LQSVPRLWTGKDPKLKSAPRNVLCVVPWYLPPREQRRGQRLAAKIQAIIGEKGALDRLRKSLPDPVAGA
jgi:hypothetical protein